MKKHKIKNGLINAGLLGLYLTSCSALAASLVPSHTHFRATQLIQSQFPSSTNIETIPYAGVSISGTVGTVLRNSTLINFNHHGVLKHVVMLPDGEHLLLGSIVKPVLNAPSNTQPIHSAVEQKKMGHDNLHKDLKMSVNAQLNKIESDHKNGVPNKSQPGHLLDLSRYRMKNSDLSLIKGNPARTPNEFFNRATKANAITTGTGNKHVYVFTDPNCPNCANEYRSSSQYSKDITFHWIPIYAVTSKPTIKQIALSQSSAEINLNNINALMVENKKPEELPIEVSDDALLKISANQNLFFNLNNKGTPVTIYQNSNGITTLVHGYSAKMFPSILAD
jgi:hypothetical protein